MKPLIKIIQSLILFSICIVVNAEEIYKKVDKKGVVEFSDHALPGSSEVDVDPNVVHTISPSEKNSTLPQQNIPQIKDNNRVYEVDDDGYSYRDDRRFKKFLREEKSSERKDVRDATPKHEVRDATPRHIVR